MGLLQTLATEMLGRIALPLAVSCYVGYSAVEQQKVLKRFAVISCIAALRPDGDAQLLPALAAALPSTSAPAADMLSLGGNWKQVWPKVDQTVTAARRASGTGSHPPAGGPQALSCCSCMQVGSS